MVSFKKMMGARIRARREALGYNTQASLAKAMGVDRTRVAKWEAGRNEPKGELRVTLLRLLQASEEEIFSVEAQAAAPTANAKTISDMTPDQLEDLVARASKRDGTINLEVARLKQENAELRAQINLLPKAFWATWQNPKKEELRLAVLYLVLGGKYRDELERFSRKDQKILAVLKNGLD